MTGNFPKVEVLGGPERRRRWATAQKLSMVEETYAPDVTVSLVARRNGVQPNQLFHWRKLAAATQLTTACVEKDMPLQRVPVMPFQPAAPLGAAERLTTIAGAMRASL